MPDSSTVQREPSHALSPNLLPGETAVLSGTGTEKEFIPFSLQPLTLLKIHSYRMRAFHPCIQPSGPLVPGRYSLQAKNHARSSKAAAEDAYPSNNSSEYRAGEWRHLSQCCLNAHNLECRLIRKKDRVELRVWEEARIRPPRRALDTVTSRRLRDTGRKEAV